MPPKFDDFLKIHLFCILPSTPTLTILSKVATFADRPGYERTSSSLWKQREEYCAALIQKAWKDHQVRLCILFQVLSILFQVVRRKVQKSKSKQSVASKKANNGKQIKVKSA